MLWFKHSSDARNSLKLRKVRRKYGADGYAIYWFCLEAVAQDVDKDNLTFDLKEDAETIGFELTIQENRVNEIMLYMIELGLFESSNNIITCMKLAERLDKSMTASPKMRKWLGENSVISGKSDGYIYFIEAEKDNNKKIKIGRSANPHARIQQLRAREDCIDWNLTLLATTKTDDCIGLEQDLHRKYKNQSLGREFFSVTDQLLREIDHYNSDDVTLQLELDKNRLDKNRNKSIVGQAQRCLDLLNELAGTKFKHVDSNIDLLKARFKEGYTEQEVIEVIKSKCSEWVNTDGSQYLRPATLFGKQKFSQYHGQSHIETKPQQQDLSALSNDELLKMAKELKIRTQGLFRNDLITAIKGKK